ncbi:MAG: SDR family oxidoreductase [Cytophagaceae bacterium]
MKKLLVITGVTKGIGREIAKKFAAGGFDIVGCARSAEDIRQLKMEFSKDYPKIEAAFFQVDVSIKDEVYKFADAVVERNQPVNVLVNNAGIFTPGQIHTEEEGVLENLIHTNLYSAYYLTRKLVPVMIKAKAGHIFNMCSTASITPYINGGAYCISKYALYGMSKVLREEMKEHEVKVTAVLPGATYTASWEGVEIPEERFMQAKDVADIVFGINSLGKNAVVEDVLLRPQLGDL